MPFEQGDVERGELKKEGGLQEPEYLPSTEPYSLIRLSLVNVRKG